jgi:hypothetical protein
VLDWGHLLDRFEQHPDGTLSLFHIYEVWPVLTDPAQPFGMDTRMLLQVSAPTTFIGDHRFYPLLDTEVVNESYPWPLARCGGVFPSMYFSTRETND